MTSRNTSFFLYLMPSDLQDTAFVTAGGGLGAVSSLCPSCVMYLSREKRESRGSKPRDREALSLLQDLALRRLRVAEVVHLVEQLVDDDEVVADALLLEFVEILAEDSYDLVEE